MMYRVHTRKPGETEWHAWRSLISERAARRLQAVAEANGHEVRLCASRERAKGER